MPKARVFWIVLSLAGCVGQIGTPSDQGTGSVDEPGSGAAVPEAGCKGAPDPGRVTMHRLNRTEYDNTIRDLLGDGSHPAGDFPPDGSSGGTFSFDNDADSLHVDFV